jgi:hypothetical protein
MSTTLALGKQKLLKLYPEYEAWQQQQSRKGDGCEQPSDLQQQALQGKDSSKA